jgi:hypothetical protein
VQNPNVSEIGFLYLGITGDLSFAISDLPACGGCYARTAQEDQSKLLRETNEKLADYLAMSRGF